tara:strand:+ start:205 stop:888 length:684 start_codon:yes stop_codon:yes gene_type:complete
VKKISIIIPVYNESDSILQLIIETEKFLKSKIEYELIIVDDGSVDETVNILNKSKKNIKLISNKKNLGQSKSLLNGIKNSSYDTVVTMDGDGQNNPSDIFSMIKLFFENNCDLVSGIRLKRRDNLIKIISSRIANFVRSKYLNDECKDTGCALKVFKKNIFLSFPFFDGIHRFLPALFKGYGYCVQFIEVDHRHRIAGVSKYGTVNRLFKGLKDMYYVKKIIKKNLV